MSETIRGGRQLRILIADDHPLFRRGIRDVIDEEDDMQVVGEAADGEQAVQRARELGPHGLDLVLMDIDMPRLGGIAATKRILAEHPGLPVVMLTVSTLDVDVFEATRAGARGFLSKSLAPAAMVRALRDFHRDGALPMSRTMAARLLAQLQQAAAASQQQFDPAAAAALEERMASTLTPREREVLELIAQGARDRDIAGRLVLTVSTVKAHVQHILRKLGARNRMEAVARVRNGRAPRQAPHHPGPAHAGGGTA